MVAGAIPQSFGVSMLEAGDDENIVSDRFEGLEDRRRFPVGTTLGGGPFRLVDTVWNEQEDGAQR